MAVGINKVYNKVLAIANKEQRGYITPQEFNLLANQAQLAIFEQYFYDTNQFGKINGNSTEYSDMLNILGEKISPFEKWKQSGTVSGNEITLSSATPTYPSFAFSPPKNINFPFVDWKLSMGSSGKSPQIPRNKIGS